MHLKSVMLLNPEEKMEMRAVKGTKILKISMNFTR
jgi:hypothetical protein